MTELGRSPMSGLCVLYKVLNAVCIKAACVAIIRFSPLCMTLRRRRAFFQLPSFMLEQLYF